MSLAIWAHTVWPVTRHKWTQPALTPARQAGTRFTYHGGMEGWVDQTGYIRRWFTRPHTVTHPNTNPAVHARELNSWPVDHKSDALTTTLPNVSWGNMSAYKRLKEEMQNWLFCNIQQTVTHPGSNRARCRATELLETNVLTTTPCHWAHRSQGLDVTEYMNNN